LRKLRPECSICNNYGFLPSKQKYLCEIVWEGFRGKTLRKCTDFSLRISKVSDERAHKILLEKALEKNNCRHISLDDALKIIGNLPRLKKMERENLIIIRHTRGGSYLDL